MGELYRRRIENRGIIHYLIGLFPRVYKYAYFSVSRWIARMHGAEIGKGSVFPIRLARKMSRNVSIGDYTSVECLSIDDRCPVKIGSHVIISFDSKIITLSHHIDSPEWEFKHYGIEIEDYVWIASNAIIMPSCRHIGRGSVVGGGSLVVKDIPEMSVVGGNPAKIISQRPCVHSELIVNSLMGGDLKEYWKTWMNFRKRLV